MSDKNIFGKNQIDALTSDDILGKEVIDTEGNFLGVVEKLFIDKINLNFNAIAVDKGLIKKGFVVGKGYIDRVTEHAVFLKTSIAFELKGLQVFDKDGEKVGKVKKVFTYGDKNMIKSVLVSMGINNDLEINSKYIAKIGENIRLNKCWREIKV